MNRTFEWAVVIATFLSFFFFWSFVPRHCAHLTYFLHPKIKEINVVLFTLQLNLRRIGSIPVGPEGWTGLPKG